MRSLIKYLVRVINNSTVLIHRKIPKISPGLLFVRKAILVGIFHFVEALSITERNSVFQNGLGLTIKTA